MIKINTERNILADYFLIKEGLKQEISDNTKEFYNQVYIRMFDKHNEKKEIKNIYRKLFNLEKHNIDTDHTKEELVSKLKL